MHPPVLGRTRSSPRVGATPRDRLLEALSAGAGAPTRVTPKTAATATDNVAGRFTRPESGLNPGRSPPSGALLRDPRAASPPRTDPLDPCGGSAESLERHDPCVCL